MIQKRKQSFFFNFFLCSCIRTKKQWCIRERERERERERRYINVVTVVEHKQFSNWGFKVYKHWNLGRGMHERGREM